MIEFVKMLRKCHDFASVIISTAQRLLICRESFRDSSKSTKTCKDFSRLTFVFYGTCLVCATGVTCIDIPHNLHAWTQTCYYGTVI